MAAPLTAAARAALARHARKAIGAARPAASAPFAAPGADPSSGLWHRQLQFDLASRLMDVADRAAHVVPSWQHAVSVAVVGGPHADMRRIWYLCCAAAFGRYRERIRTAYNTISLEAHWDITGKACTLQLVSQNNLYREAALSLWARLRAWAVAELDDAADAIIGPFPGVVGGVIPRFIGGVVVGRPADVPERVPVDSRTNWATYLHRGPEQLTIGASWPEFLRPSGFRTVPSPYTPGTWVVKVQCGEQHTDESALPVTFVGRVGALREYPDRSGTGFSFYPFVVAAPRRALGIAAGLVRTGATVRLGLPTLPDDGRIITTPEKGDPRIQPPAPPLDGTSRCSVIQIVAQALDAPCHLPSSPPCTVTPAASSGVWLYAPGSTLGEVEYTADDPNLHAYRSTVDGQKTRTPATIPNIHEPGTMDGLIFPVKQENFRGE